MKIGKAIEVGANGVLMSELTGWRIYSPSHKTGRGRAIFVETEELTSLHVFL